jgi:hypothetical protein
MEDIYRARAVLEASAVDGVIQNIDADALQSRKESFQCNRSKGGGRQIGAGKITVTEAFPII